MDDKLGGNADRENEFERIERAILDAAKQHFGNQSQVDVTVDRRSGQARACVDDRVLTHDQIGELLGLVAAETAKRAIIQKIREAEDDARGNSDDSSGG